MDQKLTEIHRRIDQLEKAILALRFHDHGQTRGVITDHMRVPFGPLHDRLEAIKKSQQAK